jgi:hypothetical protein
MIPVACSQLSDAPLPSHVAAHPMANPGYGKRSTPGQPRRTGDDFARLPAREAAIAAYIDRLPDGADISVKMLAKALPYGQCALRTALNFLQQAGHLRRGREHLIERGSARWVTRTWFSRAARGSGWWAGFIAGDVPDTDSGRCDDVPTPARQGSVPTDASGPSPAYVVLAAVGRRNPAVSLSAADCRALEPLAAEWFARGATELDILRALTEGLPTPVHHPAAFIRRRLTDKLPPEPTRVLRAPMRIMECGTCGVPGRPEALFDGECGPCRGEGEPERLPGMLAPEQVQALAAEARAACGRFAETLPSFPAKAPVPV